MKNRRGRHSFRDLHVRLGNHDDFADGRDVSELGLHPISQRFHFQRHFGTVRLSVGYK